MTDENVIYCGGPVFGPAPEQAFNLTGQSDGGGWITAGYTDRGWMLGVDDGRIVMGQPHSLWWAPIGTDVPTEWPPPAPWRELTAPVND
jgi:hypothetical protein